LISVQRIERNEKNTAKNTSPASYNKSLALPVDAFPGSEARSSRESTFSAEMTPSVTKKLTKSNTVAQIKEALESAGVGIPSGVHLKTDLLELYQTSFGSGEGECSDARRCPWLDGAAAWSSNVHDSAIAHAA